MTGTSQLPMRPPDAVLVRVPAHGPAWARSLPTVPGGATVTVTLSDRRLLAVPADDLVVGGYRIVGMHAADRPDRGQVVDLLVPARLREQYPQWWGRLVAMAERVFDCAHGPVQRVLAAELSLHLSAQELPG